MSFNFDFNKILYQIENNLTLRILTFISFITLTFLKFNVFELVELLNLQKFMNSKYALILDLVWIF